MIQVNQGRTRTTHSRVWGCFNGGSFSLELELGEVSSILCTRIFTEKGVGVLQLWLFLSGVRTQRSEQYFMYTDIHRKGGGGASIVVISLWSENSAKLAVFYVHGYVAA